jgi:hypothetical protein
MGSFSLTEIRLLSRNWFISSVNPSFRRSRFNSYGFGRTGPQQAAALVYTLAILFRPNRARTVPGRTPILGHDASRFFAAVMISWDARTIERLLRGEYAPGPSSAHIARRSASLA